MIPPGPPRGNAKGLGRARLGPGLLHCGWRRTNETPSRHSDKGVSRQSSQCSGPPPPASPLAPCFVTTPPASRLISSQTRLTAALHASARQHAAAMRLVETHSLPVAETLQSIGVSVFRGDNAQTGELGRFLQRYENGEIPPGSVLVAESLDRLTRNRVHETLRMRNRAISG